MIDLSAFPALSSVPVPLTFVRTIEEFEGPLLVEFASLAGDPFLYYWCDRTPEFTRWLVFRTTRHLCLSYEMGRSTLLDVVRGCRDSFVYVEDIADTNARRVYLVPVANLPDAYLPDSDSFFESPVDASGEFQDVLLSGDRWGYSKVSEFPRKYLQAFAFLGLFGEHGDPSGFQGGLALTQGYVFHTLYRQMEVKGRRQRAFAADVEAISYQSPGYMRIRATPTVAKDLRSVLARFLGAAPQVRAAARALQDWSNSRGRFPESYSPQREIHSLGAMLGVNTEQLLGRTQPVEAAKMMTSFVGRLVHLAKYHVTGDAVLFGVQPEVVAFKLDRSHLDDSDDDDG